MIENSGLPKQKPITTCNMLDNVVSDLGTFGGMVDFLRDGVAWQQEQESE